MPFEKSARLELENNASDWPISLSWKIETEPKPDVPFLHFHARWRREITETGKPFRLLQAEGKGHYVGAVLSMQNGPGNIG